MTIVSHNTCKAILVLIVFTYLLTSCGISQNTLEESFGSEPELITSQPNDVDPESKTGTPEQPELIFEEYCRHWLVDDMLNESTSELAMLAYDGNNSLLSWFEMPKDWHLYWLQDVRNGLVVFRAETDLPLQYNYLVDMTDPESNAVDIGYYNSYIWDRDGAPYILPNDLVVTRDKDKGDLLILDKQGKLSSLQLDFDFGEELPYIAASSMSYRGHEYYASYLAYDTQTQRYYLTYGKSAMLTDEIGFDNSRCGMGLAVFDKDGNQLDRFDLPRIVGSQIGGHMGPSSIDPAFLYIYTNPNDPDTVLLWNPVDATYYMADLTTHGYEVVDEDNAQTFLETAEKSYRSESGCEFESDLPSPLQIEYRRDGTYIIDGEETLQFLDGDYLLYCFQQHPQTGIYYYFFKMGSYTFEDNGEIIEVVHPYSVVE